MSDRRRTVVLSSPRVEADVCVEHHHNADDLLREVAEFRRERGDESREVLLFVGVEAAGPVDPSHVTAKVRAGGPNFRRVNVRAGAEE